MKNRFIQLSVLIAIICIGVAGSSSTESPAEIVKATYLEDLLVLEEDIKNLKVLASSNASVDELELQVLTTRISYKKVEYLLNYQQPQAIKDFINGAPLPTLERKVPGVFELHPEGLQVIDELVFSSGMDTSYEELQSLTTKLQSSFTPILTQAMQAPLTDREVIEACRIELITVFTLGLTGFDTPGSVNAIPEALFALESLENALANYYPHLNNKELEKELKKTFKAATKYLRRNKNFDEFDRLQFLTEYLNPLFKQTLELHQTLNIESVYEVTNSEISINYFADNLFDSTFLNVEYYAPLPKNLNRPALLKLGETLFYDPILSMNNERSCASCHNPKKSFTDGQAKSIAYNFEGTLDRNAPTLLNAVYARKFFWDLRADNLDRQAEHVILNDKEFHSSYPEVLDKLNQSEEYIQLFSEAFNWKKPQEIKRSTFAMALTSFTASLQSLNSPFDQYVRGESIELSESAKRGFNLFMGKAVCGTCHFAPHFSGLVPPLYQENESEIIGVPATAQEKELDGDMGRAASGVVHDASAIYKFSFKTPTVRNVEFTAPYMHNGVYDSLSQVMDFYNNGGGEGLGYEVPNQTLPFSDLNLTDEEFADVIAFMKSLSDTSKVYSMPNSLPAFANEEWNARKIGGTY